MSNLDPDLAMLMKHINDNSAKKITSSKNPKKKKKNLAMKQYCPCAVKFTTQKSAENALKTNKKVIQFREEVSGKMKDNLYTNCTRPCYDGNTYCYKHLCSFTKNPTNIKLFKDVLDNGKKVLAGDPIFKRKRGRKAKASKDLKNIPEDILKVLENSILKKKLEDYAKSLLNNTNISEDDECSSNKSSVSSCKSDDLTEDDECSSKKSSLSSSKSDDLTEDNDLLVSNDIDSSVDEDSVAINSSTNIKSIDNDEESSDNEESSDDDDYVEVIEIHTKDGRSLWLDKSEKRVIEPEGDDEGTVLGILHEIDSSDAPIEYEDKTYIVANKFQDDGKMYNRCGITDNVYDMDNILRGKAEKTGDGYNINFS